MKYLKIKSVKSLGVQDTLDFEVNHEDHNFYGEGVVISNSHAVGYGTLLLIMAYVKANYPKEFFAACLRNAKNEQKPTEEIRRASEELAYFNLKLLPPHLLQSGVDFTAEPDGIRFGLGNIKNISDAAIQKLENFKTIHGNKFDLFAAATECKINLGVLSSLIMVGSLDSMLTQSRSRTFLEACLWRILTEKERKEVVKIAEDNKFDLINIVKILSKTPAPLKRKMKEGEEMPCVIKKSRYKTIRTKFTPYFNLYQKNTKNEQFAQYWFEYNLLGFSYSTSLYEIWSKHTDGLTTIQEITGALEGERFTFIGQVKEVKGGKGRLKGTPYFRCTVNDHTGDMTALLFTKSNSDDIQKCIDLNLRLPKENDVVIVEGQKKGDCIFAHKITIQDAEVFMKISEIKES